MLIDPEVKRLNLLNDVANAARLVQRHTKHGDYDGTITMQGHDAIQKLHRSLVSLDTFEEGQQELDI